MKYTTDLPVRGGYDVVVVGAGPAGIGAAVTAARLGRKTLLVEKYGYPGGVGTYGCTTIFFRFGEHGRQLVGGLAEEVIRRMDARGAASFLVGDRCEMPEFRPIGDRPLLYKVITRTEDLRVVYHDILSENGVEKLFYSHFHGAIREGRRVRGIVVDSLEGSAVIEGKVFIDASGDAHLVHRAGGRTEQAAPDATMHKSIFFMVGGVTPHDPKVNVQRYEELFQADAVPDKCWAHMGYSYQLDPGIVQLAFAYANGDGCSSAEMTRMDHELRRRNFEVVEFMKREMAGYQHCYPVNAAQQVCVRSGRHICGVTKLTEALLAGDEVPPEPIVPIVRTYGSHSTDQKKGFAPAKRGTLGGFSAIPYGALVPDEFDNVLAAGRCISVDECLMDTVRMMTTCMATGQAAGMAASLAISSDLPAMARVPYPDLRQGLLEIRCILEP